MAIKHMQNTHKKKLNQSKLRIVSPFISVMQAFYLIRISRNKKDIKKLQNKTPIQIPKNEKAKPNKYTKKYCHKNRFKAN